MLCAPCARALRIAYRDQRARERRFIDLDPPAPLCHGCYHRPRISKGTRRGKRRYFRFCGPCGRAHRVEQGLPAYRGERGARMWLHEQILPEEERNRYPWPKSDADITRPSPFVPMSTLAEVLDDVGALKRESVMDLVAVHALLHTPPLFKMDAFIYAPAAPTSTALAPSPPLARSTSSPRGPGVQRGSEAIRKAGSSSLPSPGPRCGSARVGQTCDRLWATTGSPTFAYGRP